LALSLSVSPPFPPLNQVYRLKRCRRPPRGWETPSTVVRHLLPKPAVDTGLLLSHHPLSVFPRRLRSSRVYVFNAPSASLSPPPFPLVEGQNDPFLVFLTVASPPAVDPCVSFFPCHRPFSFHRVKGSRDPEEAPFFFLAFTPGPPGLVMTAFFFFFFRQERSISFPCPLVRASSRRKPPPSLSSTIERLFFPLFLFWSHGFAHDSFFLSSPRKPVSVGLFARRPPLDFAVC